MPSESAELPQFFETVETLFVMYEVPNDVKVKLLIPLLTAQAKALVNRLTVDQMGQYDELKRFLLSEYRLTPREYKTRFDTAAKSADETFVLSQLDCVICCHITYQVRLTHLSTTELSLWLVRPKRGDLLGLARPQRPFSRVVLPKEVTLRPAEEVM